LVRNNISTEDQSLSKRFHLAIEGGELTTTVPFYTDILGCKLDMAEEGKWQDIDFWGNELTLHQSTPRQDKGPDRHRHSVDMGEVCVPHLGIHLPLEEYNKVRASVEATVGFLDTPYTRFEGSDYQQETFFVEDPNYNVLEIKSMVNDG
jgi:extradiol dioxygenase family protein